MNFSHDRMKAYAFSVYTATLDVTTVRTTSF